MDNNWNNSRGDYNHGSPVLSPVFNTSECKFGVACGSFASGAYINCGTANAALRTTVGSWLAWYRYSGTPVNNSTLILLGDAGYNNNISIRPVPTNAIQVWARIGSEAWPYHWLLKTANGVMTPDTWHMVVVVQDGVHPLLYHDGILDTYYSSYTDASIWSNSTTFDSKGLFQAATGGSGSWSGLLDEIGIWNRPLTSEEIATLWSAGNGRGLYFGRRRRTLCA